VKNLRWLAVLGSQIVLIVGFWFWYHWRHPLGNLLTGDAVGQLLAYGRLAGLLAAFGVLLQLILIGRVGWVEPSFGLDRLTRLHHVLGLALLALLLAHPLLVLTGHARQADVGLWAQLLDFCRSWEDVLAAVLGLAILLTAVALSLGAVRRRLRYETWHLTHLGLYLALALVFGHQLEVGSDLTENRWFAAYWWLLYGVVLGNLLGYRVGRPLWRFAGHRFAVARLVAEPGEVTSVILHGRHLERFRARGGQFFMVRFWAPGFRWQAHPFSLSCPPDGTQLRLTIKPVGDFTRRIPQLQPGTPVILDGPHGIFTAEVCQSSRVLLLAGGIGITPIRALAADLLAAGREIILIYGNRTPSTVVFGEELEALAQAAAGRLRIIHVMSDSPGYPGEKGRVDRDCVCRLVPDVAERDVYLCGPPPMMAGLRPALLALGVPPHRLHDERFAL
jgi:predicted ferric reductase